MICPECKKEISDTAKFCRFCGSKIEKIEVSKPEPEGKYCLFCGAVVAQKAKFCKFCGANISSDEEELLREKEEVKAAEEPVFEEKTELWEESEFTEEAKVTEEPAITEEPEFPEDSAWFDDSESSSDAESDLKEILFNYDSSAENTENVKAQEMKKPVDIDETIFEEDREFLYEGVRTESSKVPLWGMPAVNADKLAQFETLYKKDEENDFRPYHRRLKPIAFSEKDTTPKPIFDSSLGSYAMKRAPEQVEETKKSVQKADGTDQENKDAVDHDNGQQLVSKLIDDSTKEVLGQKINSDSSGYIMLAFLTALFIFTVVVVGFTRLILPKLSADARSNEEICLVEVADRNLDEEVILEAFDWEDAVNEEA